MVSEDGVEITLDLAERAAIEGDSTDMRRVIANLLENARKYGRQSEDDIPQIRVATLAQHGQVELFVWDRGPGIPEDQLALVTRPFYRVDTARTQADGTGLGMAIVQRLVSRHRGALRLRNRQPGPGLEVALSFPEYRTPNRAVVDAARDVMRDLKREA
jgi:two-component system osmolarity sensor histidine kinase EnvZ